MTNAAASGLRLLVVSRQSRFGVGHEKSLNVEDGVVRAHPIVPPYVCDICESGKLTHKAHRGGIGSSLRVLVKHGAGSPFQGS